jgi:hypothetical protein
MIKILNMGYYQQEPSIIDYEIVVLKSMLKNAAWKRSNLGVAPRLQKPEVH